MKMKKSESKPIVVWERTKQSVQEQPKVVPLRREEVTVQEAEYQEHGTKLHTHLVSSGFGEIKAAA
jgi:hypothetical protein